MKAIICVLAMLCAVSYATSGVLIGKWNFKGTVYNVDECKYFCCCPQGDINIVVDNNNSSQVLLESTSWSNNGFCKVLGLHDATTPLPVPFSSTASFSDLQALSQNYTFADGADNIVYYVSGIGKVTTLGINTTQLNLTLDQELIYTPDGDSGAACTLIMNKYLVPLDN